MSAFVVSHNLIDALLTFACASGPRDCASYYVKETGRRVDITRGNVTEVGRILLQENERSVYHRYTDIRPGDANMPGTRGQDAETYEFKRWPQPTQAISVLKACSCFDYQACETDDYEASLAHTIINAIRTQAIRSLPGYDNAQGWDDFSRAKKKVI